MAWGSTSLWFPLQDANPPKTHHWTRHPYSPLQCTAAAKYLAFMAKPFWRFNFHRIYNLLRGKCELTHHHEEIHFLAQEIICLKLHEEAEELLAYFTASVSVNLFKMTIFLWKLCQNLVKQKIFFEISRYSWPSNPEILFIWVAVVCCHGKIFHWRQGCLLQTRVSDQSLWFPPPLQRAR